MGDERTIADDLLGLIRSYCKSIGGIPPGLQTKLIVSECMDEDCPIVLEDQAVEQLLRMDGQRTLTDRITALEAQRDRLAVALRRIEGLNDGRVYGMAAKDHGMNTAREIARVALSVLDR